MRIRVRRIALGLPLLLAGCGITPLTASSLRSPPIVMTDAKLSGEVRPTTVPTTMPSSTAPVSPAASPTVFPSSSAQPYVAPPSPQSESAAQAQQRVQQIESQIVAADKQLRTIKFGG
jgi:hypothetical protein